MAKKFKEAMGRGERLGLNADEVVFYDALANNREAVREMGGRDPVEDRPRAGGEPAAEHRRRLGGA